METLTLVVPDKPGAPLGDAVKNARCGELATRVAAGPDAERLLCQRRAALVLVHATCEAGPRLCRRLRLLTAAPVVALCARASLVVDCLRAGADTAWHEPISSRELHARLQALLIRSRWQDALHACGESYVVGDLEIDAGTHRARMRGRCIALTPMEFRLVLALARRRGDVIPRDDLVDELWESERGANHENLALLVRQVRRKLGDVSRRPRLVVSHRGSGYELVRAPLTEGQEMAHA